MNMCILNSTIFSFPGLFKRPVTTDVSSLTYLQTLHIHSRHLFVHVTVLCFLNCTLIGCPTFRTATSQGRADCPIVTTPTFCVGREWVSVLQSSTNRIYITKAITNIFHNSIDWFTTVTFHSFHSTLHCTVMLCTMYQAHPYNTYTYSTTHSIPNGRRHCTPQHRCIYTPLHMWALQKAVSDPQHLPPPLPSPAQLYIVQGRVPLPHGPNRMPQHVVSGVVMLHWQAWPIAERSSPTVCFLLKLLIWKLTFIELMAALY